MTHQAIDPNTLGPAERHKMTIGTIVPRPIAWVTSVDESGRVNLAPFSYFMGCHSYVPAIAVSVGSRDGLPKDTRANISAVGELVVNTVTDELVASMNVTAAAFPPGVDELAVAGLTPVASHVVSPPRVAESPIQIECRVLRTFDLGEAPRTSTLFVAEVVMWHVRRDLLLDGYKVDQAAIHAVGRMGGTQYTHARDLFSLRIPDWRDMLPEDPD